MKTKYIIIVTLILSCLSYAHDYIPDEIQTKPILLKGGNLYTISNGVKENTDILFVNGRITKIEANITPTLMYQIIDITGQNVYPGLIAPNSSLGLTEIGAVPATVDNREIGRNNADVQTHIAYNPDSELIPTVRSNGITTALIVPSGSLIRGRSSLINLDGWTKEDAMEKENLALHISWPRMSISNTWWIEKTADEQKKENAENIKKVKEIFNKAYSYYLAKKEQKEIDQDIRLEAMRPIFNQKLPVYIHANEYRQIESAIDFCQKYNLKMVLVGGNDSWKLTDKLKKFNIPVIISRVQGLPSRQDEGYDIRYKLPALLAADSVHFCFGYGSASGTRNLPFQAGHAVGFGLDFDLALRSMTLSTAEILGVDADLGSLEIGKKATIVVSSGDIMDHQTHQITYEFIEGRQVDLNDKHKELYLKYRAKNSGM